MTGFGRGVSTGAGFTIAVELASVNRRSLELTASLPKDWQSLERLTLERLRGSFQRGKIHASVQIQTTKSGENALASSDQVRSVLDRLRDLATATDVNFAPDTDLLFRIATWSAGGNTAIDTELVEPVLLQSVDAAAEALLAMRLKEGTTLLADLASRITLLQNLVAEITTLSQGTVANYRELLLARLKQAGLTLELNDERVLKEIAFFADRCDITEELTRLASHLEQFSATLEAASKPGSEAVGRKLEFLTQEIGREINTIGSKANNIAITNCVLTAKNEMERIREQLANVE